MEDVAAVIVKEEERIKDESGVSKKNTETASGAAADSTDGEGLFRCLDCGEAFGEEAAYLEHCRAYPHAHDGPIVCLDSDEQLDAMLVSEGDGRQTLCRQTFADSRGFNSLQRRHQKESLQQKEPVVAVPPSEEQKSVPPSEQQKSVPPLGQQKSVPPLGQQKSVPPSEQQKSVLPSEQQKSVVPSEQQKSVVPSEQQKSVLPSEQQSPRGTKHQLYECQDCPKSYSILGHLLNHRRSHQEPSKSVFHQLADLKKKSFRCDTCGRCYSRASALDAHRRCHEVNLIVKSRNRATEKPSAAEGSPPPPSEEPLVGRGEEGDRATEQTDSAQQKLFVCTCGKASRTQAGIKAHQRFSHNEKCSGKPKKKPERFSCSVCEKTYGSYPALVNHQRWHTRRQALGGGEKFPCEECGKVFMTLTFYYKHQRLAHSAEEVPAKSFLHQVCQLQKKAFECTDCGLRFSRASALHSHQLSHAGDVRGTETEREKEKEAPRKPISPLALPQQKLLVYERVESESFAIGSMVYEDPDAIHSPVAERVGEAWGNNDTDEEEEGDVRDFNVEVISVSGSEGSVRDEEEEVDPDLNPDLELVCESDQEGKEDINELSPSLLRSKPEIDLKIVQIDFEPLDEQGALEMERMEMEETQLPRFNCPECDRWFTSATSLGSHKMWHRSKRWAEESAEEKAPPPQRFNCPDCYRWFTSAASLRTHRMWHKVDKNKRWNNGLPPPVFTCHICGLETKSQSAHYNHTRKHVDRRPYKNILYQLDRLQKNSFKCDQCGKCFSRVSALHSHQQHHPKPKPHQCPDCEVSYSHRSGLHSHKKTCPAGNKPREAVKDPEVEVDNEMDTKKEAFNPKKTLLGPKVYHCDVCGKGFWSQGAYSLHQQNQAQCADLRQRRGTMLSKSASLPAPVTGRRRARAQIACPVCGRKFRHKGIMKSHMRSHEDGNHTCELCGKSFRILSSLLRHQFVHSAHLLPPPIKSFQHQVEQVQKNSYSCPDCGKLFSRDKALKFHMKSHGYETDYSPSSPRSAQEHKELQCPACLSHFNNKASLQSHQKLCSKKKPDGQSRDEETAQAVSSSDSVRSAKAKKLKCPTCPSVFNNLLALQYHKKLCVKSGVDDEELDVKKGDSEKVEKKMTKKEENNEMDSQTAEKMMDLKYKCKECERSFAVVGALNFHKRIHLQGHRSKGKLKPPQAPPVLKEPKQEKEPKRETPTTKGLFFCPECGRGFVSNAALGTHRRWHTDKKFAGSLAKDDRTSSSLRPVDDGPFHCNRCGKGFFYLCVLRRHQLYYPPCQTRAEAEPQDNDTSVEGSSKSPHTEFACPECNKAFNKGSLLASHYETEHSDATAEPADLQEDQVHETQDPEPSNNEAVPSKKAKMKSKVHACPHCSMRFMKIRGLRAHKWQAHSRVKGKAKTASRGKVASAETIATITEGDNTVTGGGNNNDDNTFKRRAKKESKVETVNAVVKNKPAAVSKGRSRASRRRRRKGLPLRKSIPCLDCGKTYSSAGALYNHKKTCPALRPKVKPPKAAALQPEGKPPKAAALQPEGKPPKAAGLQPEVKPPKPLKAAAPRPEVKPPKAAAPRPEVKPPKVVAAAAVVMEDPSSSPTGRSPEQQQAAKCLFKCDKCGKAFPTEDQLAGHKDLARTRPHCCALCCRGYWTETQLQQHLVWHDAVRRRLPTELRYRLSSSLTSGSPPPKLTPPRHSYPNGTKSNKRLLPPTAPPSSHHGPPRSQNSHKCQHCGKAFLSPAALQRHEDQHSSDDSYRCSLCPRTFSEIRDLIDHHQECMGDDKGQGKALAAQTTRDSDTGLTCLECGMSFSREVELHQHYIEHARGAY